MLLVMRTCRLSPIMIRVGCTFTGLECHNAFSENQSNLILDIDGDLKAPASAIGCLLYNVITDYITECFNG